MSELLSHFIAGIVPALFTFLVMWRKLPAETQKIVAEANVQDAEAAVDYSAALKEQLAVYNELFNLAKSRDDEILRLNQRINELVLKIGELTRVLDTKTTELEGLRNELAEERKKRIELEAALATERELRAQLQAKLERFTNLEASV